MRTQLTTVCLGLLIAPCSFAQVVPSNEIKDVALRSLQQGAMPALNQVANNIKAHRFDHNFYTTRALDIDESKQRRSDQHSIRFERFAGATVLAISGNYYGAYSSERYNQEQRARTTFLNVVVPLAKASVPVFASDTSVQGFAFEVSHHVIGKVMGESVERAENVMVYLPRAAAISLVSAGGMASQQAALLDGEVFVNANPIQLWLSDDGTPLRVEAKSSISVKPDAVASIAPSQVAAELLPDAPMPRLGGPNPAVPSPAVVAALSVAGPSGVTAKTEPVAAAVAVAPAPLTPTIPARDMSPGGLATIQKADQEISDRLVRELGKQAHFVAIAPPAFIAFHHQIYLEVSLDTRLGEGPGASRYKLAALAFDDHISPLIRQVLLYFQGHKEFDGISFSTTVHPAPKSVGLKPEAVSIEFFLPINSLRSYEAYDVTGQQLLNSGIILINGERVQLDLQQAEGGGHP